MHYESTDLSFLNDNILVLALFDYFQNHVSGPLVEKLHG